MIERYTKHCSIIKIESDHEHINYVILEHATDSDHEHTNYEILEHVRSQTHKLCDLRMRQITNTYIM